MRNKTYISKLYGEGLQERSDTIHWHCICLALTGRVLCLILVLRGILYTGIVHLGDRLIHTPWIALRWDTISQDTGMNTFLIECWSLGPDRTFSLTDNYLKLQRMQILRCRHYTRHLMPLYHWYILAWQLRTSHFAMSYMQHATLNVLQKCSELKNYKTIHLWRQFKNQFWPISVVCQLLYYLAVELISQNFL